MSEVVRNWAGNQTFTPQRLHQPDSVAALQTIVAEAQSVRAIGSGHSFNRLADTSGDLVSMSSLSRIVELDEQALTVTIEGGVRYGELSTVLSDRGFALHNLASLPHISVAGACATATHGSGNRNGCLSTAVRGMDVVLADGTLRSVTRQEPMFPGWVVHLGALGIVARLTLTLQPRFDVQQNLFEGLPFSALEDHFETISGAAYSVSLFTDWSAPMFNQVWMKSVDGRAVPNSVAGAVPATRKLHPIGSMPAQNCTEQLGSVGNWSDRLPHFKMEFTPSSGEELQSEYLMPRRHLPAAIYALSDIGARISELLHISEVRTMAADDLWLSPCYEQDSAGIHFTWKDRWDEVRALLPEIEARLAPFRARPHWGKLSVGTDVAQWYPRWDDFVALRREVDPHGKFLNAQLRSWGM